MKFYKLLFIIKELYDFIELPTKVGIHLIFKDFWMPTLVGNSIFHKVEYKRVKLT